MYLITLYQANTEKGGSTSYWIEPNQMNAEVQRIMKGSYYNLITVKDSKGHLVLSFVRNDNQWQLTDIYAR